jgi:hypothetical protein
LIETFPDLTEPHARIIRALAHAVDDREKLQTLIESHCSETDKYARSCFNDPYRGGNWRRTLAMHAIDCALGTCGVETIGKGAFEYCNSGDSYASTLIYCRDADEIRIGCWADYAERLGEESEASE